MRLNSTDVDSCSLGRGIMVMMNTSMKFTILKSFMMRVRLLSLLPVFTLP